MTKPQLLVDARCFQEPVYASRGIGLHLATMLAAAPARDFWISLLFDPNLPAPDPDLASLGDEATMTAYQASRSAGVFLQPAPFAFPPHPIARILTAGQRRTAAIVLDFIPYDRPDTYLPDAQARRHYGAQLASLRRYDRFLPISRATEARLHALIPRSIGSSEVTGVAVRAGLIAAKPARGLAERHGVLVVSGDDPRKNPEIAVRAALGVPISYVGIHDPGMRAKLSQLHAASGGAPDALHFLPRLSDAALADAYATARLVIAPSRAEGFSMPVAEAIAHATPVLAADEPAQAALLNPDALFLPDDAQALYRKATALLTDPTVWHSLQAAQRVRADDFSESAVAARFWPPIAALADPLPAPAIQRHAKPRLAVLTPLPPAESGCADHSASLLAALGPIADVTVFTDTIDPIIPPAIAYGGRADGSVMRAARYDAIVTVLGNSPFHRTEMRLLLDYGAGAILHDARMSGFYRGAWGLARTLGVASGELGRDVTFAELDAWDHDELIMPVRLLGEIAAASTPLIVHAAETARFLAASCGKTAIFLPFAPYRLPDAASLTARGRMAARQRLGIPDHATLVASFGQIQAGKEPARLIEVCAIVARTRPCRFALLGSGNPTLTAALRAQAEASGIAADDLTLDSERIPEAVYRDHLAAADIAVQLRRAPQGSISGALADVVAAGLPCVAAATLVEALQPPSYVTDVADDAAPAVIAAAVTRVLDAGSVMIAPARDRFLQERSMARYAVSLLTTMLR